MSKPRKHRRIPVQISVSVHIQAPQGAARTSEGVITNLSLGGAFVESPLQLSVGETVSVEIHFGETILVAGKVLEDSAVEHAQGLSAAESIVRWAQAEAKDKPTGFGVEFGGLPQAHQEIIAKMMRYYETLVKAGVSFE